MKPKSLQYRDYQVNLASVCYKENILLVIPTGLGKTAIALIIIAEYLKTNPNQKCLLLAPTRPLCHQHYVFLKKHLALNEDQIQVLTGQDSIKVRKQKWKCQVICATPQITVKDLERNLLDIKNISIIIFDEVHRAVGNYAYSIVGRKYTNIYPEGRIIGLTASLPDDDYRIKEVITNLNLQKIEFRNENSPDVLPYVHKTDIEWKTIPLPEILITIRNKLKNAILFRLNRIEATGIIKISNKNNINMKKLLDFRLNIEKSGNSNARSDIISAIRLSHAINLIETQSIKSFLKFFDRLSKRYSGIGLRQLLEDPDVKSAYESARGISLLGFEHPKINELKKLMKSLLKGEKAIIFTGYRDSVECIFESLSSDGFRVRFLIGKSGKGQHQNEQIKTIEDMKSGLFDILVATQVGEEGLDISECNLIVFYDNVPSAVRFIQRRGRTGRESPGRVVVLIAKGTRDESYYWSGQRKLGQGRKMVSDLKQLKIMSDGPLDKFIEKHNILPLVYVDIRESILLVEELRKIGCKVEIKSLEVGDFIISSEIVIERKTTDDFVKSIIDGRFFKQLVSMREMYTKPILLIEGNISRVTGINHASLLGALASTISDFQISILMSRNIEETSQIIFHIARREQLEKKREIKIRSGRVHRSISDTQKYVVSGLPGVNTILAERLLNEMRTIANIFNANETDLKRVDGVGEKLAKRIRDLTSKQYDASLD